jgi:hypothetical protein
MRFGVQLIKPYGLDLKSLAMKSATRGWLDIEDGALARRCATIAVVPFEGRRHEVRKKR